MVDLETLLLDYYEMKPLLFVFYSEAEDIDIDVVHLESSKRRYAVELPASW